MHAKPKLLGGSQSTFTANFQQVSGSTAKRKTSAKSAAKGRNPLPNPAPKVAIRRQKEGSTAKLPLAADLAADLQIHAKPLFWLLGLDIVAFGIIDYVFCVISKVAQDMHLD